MGADASGCRIRVTSRLRSLTSVEVFGDLQSRRSVLDSPCRGRRQFKHCSPPHTAVRNGDNADAATQPLCTSGPHQPTPEQPISQRVIEIVEKNATGSQRRRSMAGRQRQCTSVERIVDAPPFELCPARHRGRSASVQSFAYDYSER